jgi:hypothetical protein
MNEFWQSSPKEKLKIWRTFRKSLADLDLATQLQSTVDFWKTAPISNMIIDIYNESAWERPWDLIWNGQFDENNIALAMAYTLHLEKYADCEILLIQNIEESFIKLVTLVNSEYLLNYEYSTVSEIAVLDKCTIVKKIHVNELT